VGTAVVPVVVVVVPVVVGAVLVDAVSTPTLPPPQADRVITNSKPVQIIRIRTLSHNPSRASKCRELRTKEPQRSRIDYV
jgi:hypothetical protein